MDLQSHDLFDQLELSFEATVSILLSVSKLNFLTHIQANPNCYKIQKCNIYHKIKDEVTFTTTDPELPLPSPHLLALHIACAEVAQLSGASDVADDFGYVCLDKGKRELVNVVDSLLRYCRNVRPTWVKFDSKDTKESGSVFEVLSTKSKKRT